MPGRIKEFFHKIIKINDTPESLARGIAIGFFFGVSIFWGLQILLSLLFAQIFRGNKKASIIMTAVSNPLTTPFIYSASYKIGHLIINDHEKIIDYSVISTIRDILDLGLPFIEAIFTGTLIVGLSGSTICYFTAREYLKRRKLKHPDYEGDDK
ncbi:MAG: DUF2062 domain-containing protein [Spirochaetes bacterium]|nr:DUF2062 domain-containing protein [Spirochaetota bacterium]